jgi:RNase_H superfamily
MEQIYPEPLALDIETTGLTLKDKITCVAIVKKDMSWVWTFKNEEVKQNSRESIQEQLDSATVIYAYNGATFDIPFLQREFQFSNEVVGKWMLKLIDPLYAARALLGYEACPKLSDVLRLNGVQPKTSSGREAIEMAKEGRWDELADYCLNDTKVTFDLLAKERVYWTHNLQYVPRSHHVWTGQEPSTTVA